MSNRVCWKITFIAHTTSTSGHSVNFSAARSKYHVCKSSLLEVSVVAQNRSREKIQESVVADTKDVVCETRDTVEISG